MTTRDFCFWLQGFFEIAGTQDISRSQAEMIKQHLDMVFKHEFSAPQPQASFPTQITTPFVGPYNPTPTDPFNPSLVTC